MRLRLLRLRAFGDPFSDQQTQYENYHQNHQHAELFPRHRRRQDRSLLPPHRPAEHRLIKWLSKSASTLSAIACLEQTGHYGLPIATALHQLPLPGLCETSVLIILGELPDLAEFSDARQLAVWVGLTPSHHQSGTSGRTRTPITKIGSIHLRRALYMPAMNARVFNPLLKTFADRLIANGKKPKQVIIAVMRKLLHQIYGILKSGEPYNPEKRGFAGS